MRQEMMRFAVALVGPYTNNLHLAPDRLNHINTSSLHLYRPDALPDAHCPTNSIKALKA